MGGCWALYSVSLSSQVSHLWLIVPSLRPASVLTDHSSWPTWSVEDSTANLDYFHLWRPLLSPDLYVSVEMPQRKNKGRGWVGAGYLMGPLSASTLLHCVIRTKLGQVTTVAMLSPSTEEAAKGRECKRIWKGSLGAAAESPEPGMKVG